jgi:ATP-dependent exoDNAse (exonuclease V) beta subunit
VTGLRRLYVCLTRAVTSLIVVYAAELPAALAA